MFLWPFFINYAYALVHASALDCTICCFCKWLYLFFVRNKSCLKILSSGKYEKCLFLRTRLNICVLKLNLLEFEVFFCFHLITQCLLALCNETKLSAFQGEKIKF